jgi:hypothetical protein
MNIYESVPVTSISVQVKVFRYKYTEKNLIVKGCTILQTIYRKNKTRVEREYFKICWGKEINIGVEKKNP